MCRPSEIQLGQNVAASRPREDAARLKRNGGAEAHAEWVKFIQRMISLAWSNLLVLLTQSMERAPNLRMCSLRLTFQPLLAAPQPQQWNICSTLPSKCCAICFLFDFCSHAFSKYNVLYDKRDCLIICFIIN